MSQQTMALEGSDPTWTHHKVFRALVESGMRRKDPWRKDPYVVLYDQKPNCAVLYAPNARYGEAPLHVNPQRDSWDSKVWDRIRPFVEYKRSDNKGPGKEKQNHDHYRVANWAGFANALRLK